MKGILIVMIAFLAGCANTADTTADATPQGVEQGTPTYAVLSVGDFKEKMNGLEEYHLIDVRTPGEVAQGTIASSTNIDFNSANFAAELGKLDKSKPLMLFCRSGSRSARASKVAMDLGFTEIYDLRGGFMSWSAQ
jgi:rhodanese-related sulfurtransferase